MSVRIVTDSTCDIPKELADSLGIAIVPEYVVFGSQSYRDRIDIAEDEFYDKLVHGGIHPTTSQPTPQDFQVFYDKLGKESDGIISIHLSSGLSGTVHSANQAKKLSCSKCPIEVIDSKTVAMALGITTIAAAKMAKEGQSLEEIVRELKNVILPNIHILAVFDTLTYLARGGRIGKAKSLIGSLLNVKPLLTIKDGEFTPVLQVRSSAKAKDKLVEFANSFHNIKDLSVVYSTEKEEAIKLSKRISVFPDEQIILSQLGPVIGTHTGPGLLAIVVRTG